MLALLAVWLLVLGYAMVYTGLSNFWGKPVGLMDSLTVA